MKQRPSSSAEEIGREIATSELFVGHLFEKPHGERNAEADELGPLNAIKRRLRHAESDAVAREEVSLFVDGNGLGVR